MLQNLYVKNLALIDETEVEFGEGLNILTGETGAGKSILLGSVTLALGGKYNAQMLRNGAKKRIGRTYFSYQRRKDFKEAGGLGHLSGRRISDIEPPPFRRQKCQ